jgi:hypothetical protein
VADRIVYSYDFSGSNDSNAPDTFGHGSNIASIVGFQDGTGRLIPSPKAHTWSGVSPAKR